MSIFSIIGKQLGKGAVLVLADPTLRDGVCDMGKRGFETVCHLFDKDGDGDVDQDDFQFISDYLTNLGSLLGQAAAADGKIEEVEEDEAADLIEYLVFSEDGFLPAEAIAAAGWSIKELRQSIMDAFQNPLAIKKIVAFAIENDLEEFFFQYACLVANADKEIHPDEREFLDELASQLQLSPIDRRRIERWNITDDSNQSS